MYKVSSSQNRVPRGRVRYLLETRVNGKRFRSRIVCPQSQIEIRHAEWLLTVEAGQPDRGLKEKLFNNIDIYLSNIKDKKDKNNYRAACRVLGQWREWIGDVSLDTIRRYMIVDYLETRRGAGMKPNTIITEKRIISTFLGWCVEREKLSINPAHAIKGDPLPVRTPLLTAEQVREILSIDDRQLSVAVHLSIYAGLRIGEITTLQWNDVDFSRGIITIQAVNSKNGKSRMIPLASSLRSFLLERRGIGRVVGVLSWAIRKRWTLWRTTREWAKDLHYHDLRHVFVLKCLQADVPLQLVSEWAGHYSSSFTQKIYGQTAMAHERQEEIEKLSSILSV